MLILSSTRIKNENQIKDNQNKFIKLKIEKVLSNFVKPHQFSTYLPTYLTTELGKSKLKLVATLGPNMQFELELKSCLSWACKLGHKVALLLSSSKRVRTHISSRVRAFTTRAHAS